MKSTSVAGSDEQAGTQPAAAEPPMARTGALVRYCGHNAMFVADVFEVGTAVAIYANGNIESHLMRPATDAATHHMVDFPNAGMWKPRRGVFVVPREQVKVLQ